MSETVSVCPQCGVLKDYHPLRVCRGCRYKPETVRERAINVYLSSYHTVTGNRENDPVFLTNEQLRQIAEKIEAGQSFEIDEPTLEVLAKEYSTISLTPPSKTNGGGCLILAAIAVLLIAALALAIAYWYFFT